MKEQKHYAERMLQFEQLASEAVRGIARKYGLFGSVERCDDRGRVSTFLSEKIELGPLSAQREVGAGVIGRAHMYTFSFLSNFSSRHHLLAHIKTDAEEAARQILKETNDVV